MSYEKKKKLLLSIMQVVLFSRDPKIMVYEKKHLKLSRISSPTNPLNRQPDVVFFFIAQMFVNQSTVFSRYQLQ